MNKQFVLFIVINNVDKYNKIKKKLIDSKYYRFTVVDTLGSTCVSMQEDMQYSSLMVKSLGEQDERRYNKTIMLVVENEEDVEGIMDGVESILYKKSKKPGTGFMFTVPVFMSHGVRYE